jgi:hypothetical protein
MSDLIPRKSWTLAFEEMEDVVFHLKELNDSEYLDLMDIVEPIFTSGSTQKEIEKAKLKASDFMIESVEGLDVIGFKVKLNIAIQVLKYINPDVLNLKKQ